MAGLPPGDPQLVAMIVNHLKTQGLFDQFRRDCLADVDTKPAYLNLRQRVDNFVSNHLSNHTWSPHLNKNQLRNNIRQLVLQSGMLEQGVDRIVAQVVDPKIHHTFRPQVEKVVHEFLSPGTVCEQPVACPNQVEERLDNYILPPGPSSVPVTTGPSDAMSILDTITSLNQEASVWTTGDKFGRRVGSALGPDGGPEGVLSMDEAQEEMEVGGEQDMSLVGEEDSEPELEEKGNEEEEGSQEKPGPEALVPVQEAEVEDAPEAGGPEKQRPEEDAEAGEPVEETREVTVEEGKDKEKEKDNEKEKEKACSKSAGKAREDGEPQKSPSEKQHIRQKARERLKEEYSLEDSDLDGLSDITVSSVHTSDLSSFEEESEEEPQLSDSTEEGEITSEEEELESKPKATDTPKEEELKERKPRGGRQAYVHKPFLYSRYYSDSDDEVTVEQRRRSAAKEKEERLLKRQLNRERLEEKRRQKAAQQEEHDEGRSESSSPMPEPPGPSAKEARKQKKVLEKKVAISRKRKRDSRKEDEARTKKRGDVEEELLKKSDEVARAGPSKGQLIRGPRRVSEADEGRRRKSSSVSEESLSGAGVEPRRPADRSRTHSFILDLEQGSEGLLRQRPGGKFDRNPKQHPRERGERERSLSEEHPKHRPKTERRVSGGGGGGGGGGGESNAEESPQKYPGQARRKSKSRGDRPSSASAREGRISLSEGGAAKEGAVKRARAVSVEGVKTEKAASKSEGRLLLAQQESAGSSEDRSDMELGSEVAKKDRQPKDAPKRSKSQPEVRDAAARAGSESDVDPGSRVKTPAVEKSRSRSREEPKAQASPWGERKGSAHESKGKGTKLSKEKRKESVTNEEKRREGSLKEERKGSKESAAEKGAKGPTQKGAEVERAPTKAPGEEAGRDPKREEEPSPGSSLSPPFPETGASAPVPLPDTSVSSEGLPVCPPAPFALGLSEDTYDALSDITPDPEDDDEMQVDKDMEDDAMEAPDGGLPLVAGFCPGGSDSAVGQVQPGWPGEHGFGMGCSASEMSLREAALTLLSMDPDTTTSPGVVAEETSLGPRQPGSRGDETGGSSRSVLPQIDRVSDSLAASEAGASQVPHSEPAVSAGHLYAVVKEVSVPEVSSASEITSSQEATAVLCTETKAGRAKTPPEPQPKEKPAAGPEVTSPLEQSQELNTVPDSEGPNITSAIRAEASDGRYGEMECSELTATVQTDGGEPSAVAAGEKGKVESQGEAMSSTMETAPRGVCSPGTEGERQADQAIKADGSAKEEEVMEEVVTDRKGQQAKAATKETTTKETATKETGKEKKIEDKGETKGEPSDLAAEVQETRRGGRHSRLLKRASWSSKSSADSLDRSPQPSADDREAEVAKDARSQRGRSSLSAPPQRDTSKTRKDKREESPGAGVGQPPKRDEEGEKAVETRGPPRGRWTKGPAPSLRETRSSSQELEVVEVKEQEQEEEKSEDVPVRRGRSSASQSAEVSDACQQKKAVVEEPKTGSGSQGKREEKEEDERSDQKKRRGRPAKAPPPPAGSSQSEETLEQRAEKDDGENSDSKGSGCASKPGRKRKSSEEEEDTAEVWQKEVEGKDGESKRRIGLPRDDSTSQSDGQEDVKEESSNDNDEDRNQPKKTKKRGRPSKGDGATGEESGKTGSEKKDQKSEDTEEEEGEGEAGEEEEGATAKRATTRSASRLEAERNKPSKPSTRALSKLSTKEETTTSTRGRGQAHPAGRGGRKREREPSPPVPRTRGGQKSEEPPAKRGKR